MTCSENAALYQRLIQGYNVQKKKAVEETPRVDTAALAKVGITDPNSHLTEL